MRMRWLFKRLGRNTTPDTNATAEQVLEAFLTAWQKHEWQSMAHFVQRTWYHETRKHWDVPQRLEASFESVRIKNFSIKGDCTPKEMNDEVVADFTVKIKSRLHGEYRNMVYVVRLLRERKAYKPDARGVWGVNPASLKMKARR